MSSTTTSIGSSFRNSLCSFLAIVLKVNGIWVVGSPVQFFILPRLLRKTFVSHKAHLLLKVLFLLLLHKSSNMHPMDLLFDPLSVSKHFSLVFHTLCGNAYSLWCKRQWLYLSFRFKLFFLLFLLNHLFLHIFHCIETFIYGFTFIWLLYDIIMLLYQILLLATLLLGKLCWFLAHLRLICPAFLLS